MEKIALSWNSRTPEGIIANDENFKDIVAFIKKGKVDGGKWIINFYGYDNEESKAFREKLIAVLKKEISDKNFRWEEEEIHFFAQESQHSPEELLQKFERIPTQESGIVPLYEPIDYRYIISAQKDRKYDIHKKIANIFEKKKLFLFLFGNIPYDIHHFEENSPLMKYIWREFEIKEYNENELKILVQLKEKIVSRILKYTNGNFGLVSGLEAFWEEIKVEDRVNDLLNNFLEIPIKTEIEKMVYEKLECLSGFLKNNQDLIKQRINYDKDKISITKEKSNEVFKAYFDKTALFNKKEVTPELQTSYELEPKVVFAQTINESGFIKNKGKIESPQRITKDYSREFSDIASYFETKKPIFILGAGNSLVSGSPDRRTLFIEVLEQINPDDKGVLEEMPYMELRKNFQNLITSRAHDDIRYRVIKLLRDLKPSIGHFHLSQLVKSEKSQVKVLITTNFDTLLEDSLMDYGIRSRDFIKLVSEENINADEWDWVNNFPEHLKIFKICGDMYYESWFAVDDDAANNWIESALKALVKLDDFRQSSFFIILGHKFEEIDLGKIFEEKLEQNLTVVYANPNEGDCQQFEQRYRHKCKLTWISGDSGKFDNFMEELCRRLRERKLI